ncbi:hypothetical protein M513_11177 [Trichuris suis]|uniref:Uncharacterized protein n=1 Tax=Trichuris suis TaxID=68888 RepID=A0A085LSJ8_9BILA|nr:hypothetical protein M513_11177 [Trichuris suis]
MKLSPYCTLLLLFPLLSAQKNESPTEQDDKPIEEVAEGIGDLLPSPQPSPCQRKESPWRTAAKNVLAELSKLMHPHSNVTLEKVILGAKCSAAAQRSVILHMKIGAQQCRESGLFSFCKSGSSKSAYCSWIGRLDGLSHEKTFGAMCYTTEKISEEEEWTLATMDVCSLWRYGDTILHRLLVPVGLEKWKKSLILYRPVATDPSMQNESVSTTGQSYQSMYRNPQGRAGIVGRGLLKHLGENLMELPILLRDTSRGREILLASTNETRTSIGPFGVFYRHFQKYRQHHNLNLTDAEDYFYTLVEPVNGTKCDIDQFRKDMNQKRTLFNTRVHHPHETDNAWVKLKIYFLTVSSNSCLYDLNLKSEANHFHFQWKPYSDARLQSLNNMVTSNFKFPKTRAITSVSYLQRAYYVFYLSDAATAVVVLGAATAFPSLRLREYLIAVLLRLILVLAGATTVIYKRRWHGVDMNVESCNA